MRKILILLLLCTSMTAYAGCHRGNKNYHHFHSNERRCNNNGSAVAGGIIVGAALGMILYNCIDSCNSRPRPYVQNNYYHNEYYYTDYNYNDYYYQR